MFGSAFQGTRALDTDTVVTTKTLSEEFGLAPRVFKDIIDAVQARNTKGHEVKIFLSFVEIYNDKLRDLLVSSGDSTWGIEEYTTSSNSSFSNPGTTGGSSSEALKVREHPIFGPYIENLQKVD